MFINLIFICRNSYDISVSIYYIFILFFRCDLKFKAPCVPFIPAIAITVNIYLIFKLSVLTLVRFLVWMSVGKDKIIFWYYV